MVGFVLVLIAVLTARSVALARFGLDSLIEILGSLVVVWQLPELHVLERERGASASSVSRSSLLATYISASRSTYVLAAGDGG